MTILFSELLTQRDTAGAITDASTYAGDGLTTKTFFNMTTNVANDDVVMMLDLPSNSKPYSLYQYNENLGDGSMVDYGIYASNGFVDTNNAATVYEKNQVIKQGAFDVGNANLNIAVLLFHETIRFRINGTSSGLDRLNQTMWQLADLDSDPHVDMRIGIKFTTAFSSFTGGLLLLISDYSAK